ncbi:MFS transporter [Streptomyces griseoluteus]|uniref:MFS transporter n=1 Tax=Streptomyces griseoluteus TaxID=29306 RepID=UPI0036794A07
MTAIAKGPDGRPAQTRLQTTFLPRLKPFNLYLTGESASRLGSAAHAVALPALATLTLHANTRQVAILTGLAQLPMLLCALPAGALADRHAKKAFLITTELIAAGTVLAIPVSALAGRISMTMLYGLVIILSTATVLHQAAAIALVPELVPSPLLPQAHASVGAAAGLASTIGSNLGAVALAGLGAARSFTAAAVTHLLSAWCALHLPAPPPQRPAAREPLTIAIRAGFRYSLRTPVVRPLVLCLPLAGIGTGLIEVYRAYYLLTELHSGTIGLGVTMAAAGLGGFSGALSAPHLTTRYDPGPVLIATFAAYAALGVPLVIAQPGRRWLTVLTVTGAAQAAVSACSGATQRAIRQRLCPPALQGRAEQTSTWLLALTRPIAAAAGGILATAFSVHTVLTIGSAMLFLPVAFLWFSGVGQLSAELLPIVPGARLTRGPRSAL